MNRSFCVFAALLLACAAVSAPAPGPFAGGWSNPIDLDNDCKIRRSDGVLTLEMPGSDHDYDPIRKRFNAPRLLRDVEGNFKIQVRAWIDCCPSDQSTAKGQPSCVSAGFLVIYPETGRCICDRFECGISQPKIGLDGYTIKPHLPSYQKEPKSRKGIGEGGYAAMKVWDCNKQKVDRTYDRESARLSHDLWDRGWRNWPLSPMPKKTNCFYLRLERQNGWFNFFISADGEKWTALIQRSDPHTKLKLGLAAYSTSSESSKVRFDRLKLTWGE